jgi:hypothetical protein
MVSTKERALLLKEIEASIARLKHLAALAGMPACQTCGMPACHPSRPDPGTPACHRGASPEPRSQCPTPPTQSRVLRKSTSKVSVTPRKTAKTGKKARPGQSSDSEESSFTPEAAELNAAVQYLAPTCGQRQSVSTAMVRCFLLGWKYPKRLRISQRTLARLMPKTDERKATRGVVRPLL